MQGVTVSPGRRLVINVNGAPADTTPPVITVPSNIVVTAASGASGATITFPAVTANDAVDGARPVTQTAGLGSGATFPIGVTTNSYSSTDVAGNTSTASFTVTVNPAAPAVTAVSPSSGPTSGGTVVTITGTDFTGATAVDFGATPATGFTFNSATQITATAPAGTGTVDVRVTTAGGTSATSAADRFTYVAAPTVTSLNPSSGRLSGGHVMSLGGTNLSGATAVTFGGTPAVTFGVDSPTTMSVMIPAGVAGTVDVQVTTAGGTSSASGTGNDYTYVAVPAVPVVVTPANGSLTSDNTPTVTGTAPANTDIIVYFDSVSSGLATTSDGAGNWSWTLPFPFADGPHTFAAATTNVGGTSASSNINTFTVDTTPPPPPVTLTPASGSLTNNAVSTVTGTAEAASTVAVIVDGSVAGTTTADGSGNWAFTTSALSVGSHTVRATATDAAGNTSATSNTNTFTYSPLSLPGGALSGGQVGVGYSASVTATGGTAPYGYAVTAGALPPGITLSSGGALSGTPTASGAFNFTVTVTDNSSLTASSAYSIPVAAPAPPTANPGSATVTGTGGSQGINLSGSVGNAASIEIVSPPAHGTATVSGFTVNYTPEPGYFGVVTFTFKAVGYADGSNPPSESAPATITITIPDPVLALPGGTLPGGSVASAYSQALSASGGTAPYTYALTAGALPAGVTLSSAGVISGTPTAGGDFSFSVTATDSSTGTGPFTITGAYTLAIVAPTITLSPASLSNPTVAVAGYSQTITATGGTATYTYALTAGALPAGMSLTSGGVLSGTPTAGGVFNFTVTATDSSTGSGPYTGSRAYSLTVNAAAIVVTPATVPAATRGFAYSQTFSATGGVGTYSYTVSAGALPPGVTLSSTGVLSGTPTGTGTFTFTVRATDQATGSGPFSGDVSLTLVVNAATITVTPTALPGVMAGVAYDRSFSATGGSGAYTYAVTSGALPAGITLSSTGRLSGTSYAVGSYPITVRATDAFGNTGTVSVVLNILARPDPSADPDVRGLDAAQADATRRLATVQIDNVNRRLEQLHSGAGNQPMSMGLNLNSGVAELGRAADLRTQLGGGRMFDRQMADPDRAELNAMLWSADATAFGGASDKAGFGSNTGMGVDGLNAAPTPSGDGPSGGLRFWTGGAISFGQRDAETGQSKFSIHSGGLSVGADMALSPTLDFGLAGGFGEESADIGSADSSVESRQFVGMAYGSWRPQPGIYLDAMLGYGSLEFDLQRRATGDNSLVTGQRDGTAVFGSVGLGFDHSVAVGHVNAYGRVESIEAELDAYTETGSALWALSYAERDVESLQGVLGARYAWAHEERDSVWTPSFRIEYRHEFADGGLQSLQYADWAAGPVYQIQSTGWDRSEFVLDLGLNVTTSSGWKATGELGGRFSTGQTLGTIRFLLSRKF